MLRRFRAAYFRQSKQHVTMFRTIVSTPPLYRGAMLSFIIIQHAQLHAYKNTLHTMFTINAPTLSHQRGSRLSLPPPSAKPSVRLLIARSSKVTTRRMKTMACLTASSPITRRRKPRFDLLSSPLFNPRLMAMSYSK